MSHFDLRDISDRLTRSRDTEAVIYEFLGYLQSIRSGCHASLSFYEVSQDALVNLYERQGNRLVRRDILLAVDQLPARLVRKFFHPSAFFNQTDRRSLFSPTIGSPSYVPDPLEMRALAPLTSARTWQSCVCLPLADREDMLAMVMVVSDKRGAFGSREVADLIPVKSLAALALAQHLHRSGRQTPAPAPPLEAQEMPPAAAEFQQRIQLLTARAQQLEADNLDKARQLETLMLEIGQLDQSSTQYREELDRVKGTLFALEEQSEAATAHLTEAYSQLNSAQSQMAEFQRTMGFLRDACQLLGEEHDPTRLPTLITSWFSENFGVERCSLMLYDAEKEALRIAAHRGIEPDLAERVKVRLGQGIAGWVAHNRRPLLVRARNQESDVQPTGRESYNSDSFISTPLVYNNRLLGVLNLSNKPAGEPFDDCDLDRAMIASAIMATVLSGQDTRRLTQSR